MTVETKPIRKAVAVTPGTTTFETPFRAVYVGASGDVVITMENGDVTHANLAAGGWHFIAGSDIKASGTTATDILAGW